MCSVYPYNYMALLVPVMLDMKHAAILRNKAGKLIACSNCHLPTHQRSFPMSESLLRLLA